MSRDRWRKKRSGPSPGWVGEALSLSPGKQHLPPPPRWAEGPTSQIPTSFSNQEAGFMTETTSDPEQPAEGGPSRTPRVAGAWSTSEMTFSSNIKRTRPGNPLTEVCGPLQPPPHVAPAPTPGQAGRVQARRPCGHSPRPRAPTRILLPIPLWMVTVTLHPSEMFTLLKQLLFGVIMTLFPVPPASPLTCSQTGPPDSSRKPGGCDESSAQGQQFPWGPSGAGAGLLGISAEGYGQFPLSPQGHQEPPPGSSLSFPPHFISAQVPSSPHWMSLSTQ